MRSALLGLFLVLSVLAPLACGSARRGEPIRGRMAVTSPELERGRRVFMRKCDRCHPGGEGGLGPSLNDKPLPGFYIKYQVRHGVGAMPSFPERAIGDEELDDLVDYLVALRKHGAGRKERARTAGRSGRVGVVRANAGSEVT